MSKLIKTMLGFWALVLVFVAVLAWVASDKQKAIADSPWSLHEGPSDINSGVYVYILNSPNGYNYIIVKTKDGVALAPR